MKTILVPVNFTNVSKNAAQFAIKLAEQLNYKKIVLYNAFEAPIPQNSDPMGIASAPFSMYDVQEFKTLSLNGLEQLKNELKIDIPTTLTLETLSEFGGMTTIELDETCQKINADLIVTGTSDDDLFDDSASDAISLAKSTTIPLIAVPNNCVFKPIKMLF